MRKDWRTNRIWLREIVRGWWLSTGGFAGGSAIAGIVAQRFLFWVWVVAAAMLLVAIALTVTLLVLRRRDQKPNVVQRHLDSVLPPVPTPEQTAAQRKERGDAG